MRHCKRTCKLNRNAPHRRAMVANSLKNLIEQEKIVTTLPKAKELRRHADKMITLGKKQTLASRRSAIGLLMIRYNSLDSKEKKAAKQGDKSSYNRDRHVIDKLFGTLAPRFATRNGGYTRITKLGTRNGDNAELCQIEYIQ